MRRQDSVILVHILSLVWKWDPKPNSLRAEDHGAVSVLSDAFSMPFSMPGLQAGHKSGKCIARAWWAHLLLSAEGNNTYYFTSMFTWECLSDFFLSVFIAHTTNGWMYVFDQISSFECPAYKSQIFATSSSQITAEQELSVETIWQIILTNECS